MKLNKYSYMTKRSAVTAQTEVWQKEIIISSGNNLSCNYVEYI
jgi:hypothetical protein